MKQESGTYVFMTLDKIGQERLLVFGIVAVNEGRMLARLVQEVQNEFSEAERTDSLGHQRVDCQVLMQEQRSTAVLVNMLVNRTEVNSIVAAASPTESGINPKR